MQGKCHICKDQKEIKWCGVCQHWFCADCRKRYWARGLEAVKELTGGKKPGCCGPSKEDFLKHTKVVVKYASNNSESPQAS